VDKALAQGEQKQVEKSHTGFDVLWYRNIEYKYDDSVKEEIFTRYRAIPAKILISPLDPDPNAPKETDAN
jgi:hypothetical protein